MTAASRTINLSHGPETLSAKHTLPPLPYDYDALEPYIDAKTMMLHHDQHHASYVIKLNSTLAGNPELQDRSALWLLLNLDKTPLELRVSIRHNAGGHVNHSLFWRAMSPAGRGSPAPVGALAEALDRDFGGLEQFKRSFNEAGEQLFGSGWVWLAESRQDGGRLQICTTNGHSNPLLQGHFPILLNDVWEHAYYLKYENRRRDYLHAWWSLVNWDEAMRRYDRASDQAAKRDWEDEGGMVQGLTK